MSAIRPSTPPAVRFGYSIDKKSFEDNIKSATDPTLAQKAYDEVDNATHSLHYALSHLEYGTGNDQRLEITFFADPKGKIHYRLADWEKLYTQDGQTKALKMIDQHGTDPGRSGINIVGNALGMAIRYQNDKDQKKLASVEGQLKEAKSLLRKCGDAMGGLLESITGMQKKDSAAWEAKHTLPTSKHGYISEIDSGVAQYFNFEN